MPIYVDNEDTCYLCAANNDTNGGYNDDNCGFENIKFKCDYCGIIINYLVAHHKCWAFKGAFGYGEMDRCHHASGETWDHLIKFCVTDDGTIIRTVERQFIKATPRKKIRRRRRR